MALLGATLIIINPDLLIRNILMGGVDIVSTKDTPYGNISEGRYGGKPTSFMITDLLPIPTIAMERQEDIHFAMLQDRPLRMYCHIGPIKFQIERVVEVLFDIGHIYGEGSRTHQNSRRGGGVFAFVRP